MYFHHILTFLATGAYSGKSPVAPGTAGTVAGAALVYLTSDWPLIIKTLVFILLLIGGIIASEYHEHYTGIDDPGEVVIDEIAAIYLVMLFFPFTWTNIILAFIIFRVFDITKPWPIKKMESVGGGVAVMLDDIIAALYSIAVFIILRSLING
ncbi:phosphatidylglycerophosphatase A family protein [Limisalsivibrio acetivorans]|uniref:phosphatidylglycerophosphatase A family protein n=1 Tax=Limisalsivibrio acetivorans TaxID=1304888 RepID=UPI0003B32D01|nr:phosphatidylglycerophosphatase A [Limisalsivibrio acetivorans]